MGRTADVVIVGGGVIGLTTAYELLRARARVIVLERGEPGRQASWAGAGILPPGNPERATNPYDQLRAQSVDRWPGLSNELRALTGINNGYFKCGGVEHVTPAYRPNTDLWRLEGIAFETVKAGSLTTGYFVPDMAQVRNPWHLRALTAAVVRLGGEIRPHWPVVGWERDGDAVTAARGAQGSVAAGEFLVCGGAWTDELLYPFGLHLGVRPVRGQMILYRAGEAAPACIHVWDKEYVVPRADGFVLVGSTEEDAGFAPQPTAEGIARLREFAAGVFPNVAASPIEATWAGLRPGSLDGWPSLGRVPGVRNLAVAAGHYRSGIGQSPATGLALARLLRGEEPALPLAPFRPGRPAAAAPGPAFRS